MHKSHTLIDEVNFQNESGFLPSGQQDAVGKFYHVCIEDILDTESPSVLGYTPSCRAFANGLTSAQEPFANPVGTLTVPKKQ